MALCVMASPRAPACGSGPAYADNLWATPAHEVRTKRGRPSDFDNDHFTNNNNTTSTTGASPLVGRDYGKRMRLKAKVCSASPCPAGKAKAPLKSCLASKSKAAAAAAKCSLRIDIAATHRVDARDSPTLGRAPSPLGDDLVGAGAGAGARPASPCSAAGSVDTSASSCCDSLAGHGVGHAKAGRCQPLRKRRCVRFGFDVKVHDGLCCANRIFDELVWEQVTTYNVASSDDVVRMVERQLAKEHECAVMAALAPRGRSSSAVSTDSDDSEDAVPTLAQALTSLQHQTLDLARRIAEADREAAASQLGFGGAPEVSVPVLPRGGGLAAKLTPRHLRLVMGLAEMVQEALEDTAAAARDCDTDDLSVELSDLEE